MWIAPPTRDLGEMPLSFDSISSFLVTIRLCRETSPEAILASQTALYEGTVSETTRKLVVIHLAVLDPGDARSESTSLLRSETRRAPADVIATRKRSEVTGEVV